MDPEPDVTVLHWPQQAAEAAGAAADRRPRLLLVAPDADPPRSIDDLEEWIRLPADERDVAARVQLLATRAALSETATQRPRVDSSDRLFYGEDWVALSPIEARLASALAEKFGEVVHEAELGRRGWPDDDWPGPALRVHLTRLRHKIEALGLEIPSVRRHGVVLQARRGRSPDNSSRRRPRHVSADGSTKR